MIYIIMYRFLNSILDTNGDNIFNDRDHAQTYIGVFPLQFVIQWQGRTITESYKIKNDSRVAQLMTI